MKTKGSQKKKTKKTAGAAKKAVAKKVKAKPVVAAKKPAPKKAPPAKAARAAKAAVAVAVAAKKAAPKEVAPKKPRVVAIPAAVAPATEAVEPAPAPKVVPAAPEAAVVRSKSVVRIAGGRARGPQPASTHVAFNGTTSGANGMNGSRPVAAGASSEHAVSALGGRLEVNPRLESTRGKIRTPPPAAMAGQTVKGMTVAEKRRAEAEAMFQQYAKPGMAPTPTPTPTASPKNGHGNAGPSAGVDEYGRFSHRDSLMTMLRMAEHRSQAVEAATELADRYQLPADQALLLKVIDLGEARLTKLALEELLELQDRGRVRPSDQLRASLAGVQTQDPETRELKDLLLAKVGVRV